MSMTKLRVRRTGLVAIAGAVALSLVGAACGSSSKSGGATTTAGGATTTAAPSDLKATLNASGATFPQAFYQEAITAFTAKNKGVTINYAGGGSGKGRKDLADQLVDWAGSDGVIKDVDLPTFKGGEVLYFPTVVAPITVSYNLSGVKDLKLSADTIAKIYQKQITSWDDAAIKADNTGATLPATPIVVAVRSDSSGTTENFTKFLDAAAGASGSGVWTLKSGSTVTWPAGVQAGNGNPGVAQIVKSTAGAIGYVDLSDAKATGLSFAMVKNKAGTFIAPTVAGATAAAEKATIAPNLTYFAGWAEGDLAYPIAAQTWILAYAKQTDKAKGEALKAFLTYVLTDGQALAGSVDFGKLPAGLEKQAIDQLAKLQIPA